MLVKCLIDDLTMSDLILDANVLGDFFAQYFSVDGADRGQRQFQSGEFLSDKAAFEVNRIVAMHRREDQANADLVVISPFAFIELVRRWNEITSNRFTTDQLQAFIKQPPDWATIATWDETLLPAFIDVPGCVWMKTEFKPIEWCDAIYAATALARGDNNYLATTDKRLLALRMNNRLRCI